MRPRAALVAVAGAGCAVSGALAPWWVTSALAGAVVLVARPAGWRRSPGSPTRRAAHAVATVFGVVLVAASAPAAAARVELHADVTANRRLTLSPETRQVLRTLRHDVEITGFFARGSGEAAAFRDLLDQYRRESDHVDVNLFDPDAEPGLARRFALREYGTIFVESRGRRTETNVAAEIELTSAILRVVRGQPKRVCMLEGHGEGALDDPTPVGFSGLAEALLANNTEVVALDLARRPTDLEPCRLVVMAGPTVDLLPEESMVLARWLRAEGKLLAMVDPSSDADLSALLRPWGIRPEPGVVVDEDASVPGDPATLLVRRFPSENPVARGLARLVLPEAGGSALADDVGAGLTTSAVATSSPAAVRVTDDGNRRRESAGRPTVLVAAADASRVLGSGPSARIQRTRVLWIGDSDFATNAFIPLVSNRALVLNAVNWLLLEEDLIAIGAPPVEFRALLLTGGERDRLFYTTVIAVPGAILVAGIVVRLAGRRRERR